jgi:hypothetical protein
MYKKIALRNLITAHESHQDSTPGFTDNDCGICQYATGALFARDDSHAAAIRDIISTPDTAPEWTLIVKNA